MFIPMLSYSNEIRQVEIFKIDSYKTIMKEKQNQPFILLLWSLDCPPCIEELDMLSRFSKQHKDIDLVFVSTDTPSQIDEIVQLMTRYGLRHYSQWVFSDNSAQHLRYAIDPAWYGELPRSYLNSREGKRLTLTGRLDHKLINAWYESL